MGKKYSEVTFIVRKYLLEPFLTFERALAFEREPPLGRDKWPFKKSIHDSWLHFRRVKNEGLR